MPVSFLGHADGRYSHAEEPGVVFHELIPQRAEVGEVLVQDLFQLFMVPPRNSAADGQN